MQITIKSECDSRIFVYPLLKCLYNFGTIALYTSNSCMSRLIEEDGSQGFRDIVVYIVNDSTSVEDLMESDGYTAGKYDFTIFDNVGVLSVDILIALVTNHISDTYKTDLLCVIDEPTTHVIKIGKPAPGGSKPKPEKKTKNPKANKDGEEPEVEEEEEEEIPDALYNKWRVEKTEEDFLKEKLADRNSKWIPFPSFETIEEIESRHVLIPPDDATIKEIHRLFEQFLHIDERMFKKGVKVKDESSGNLSGADIR